MINSVIFDLDGTLLNSLDDLADSTNYTLRTAGYPERTRDEVRRFVGNGIYKLIERAEMHGKSLCGLLPYLSYAECTHKPCKAGALTVFNGIYKVFGRFFAHSVELGNRLHVKRIQLGRANG